MSEIRNLTRNGETFYPLTIMSAVLDENTGESLVVDELPTAESTNLVQSGGVENKLSLINGSDGIFGIKNLVTERKNGFIRDGVITEPSNSWYYSNLISVTYGHTYLYNRTGGSTVGAITEYDSNGNYIGQIAQAWPVGVAEYTPSSSSVVGIRVCVGIGIRDLAFVEPGAAYFATMSALNDISADTIHNSQVEYATGNNLANPDNILEDTLTNNQGTITPGASEGWDTLMVPVSAGQVISFGGFSLGRGGYAVFRNDGGNNIGEVISYSDPQGNLAATVTTPSGATKLYFDIKSPLSPTNPYQYLMVNFGDSLLPYEEYYAYVKFINNVPLDNPKINEKINNLENEKYVGDNFIQQDFSLKGNRTSISFIFDDGTIQDTEIKGVFDEYGLKCGFAIITPESRYRQFAEEGFEILAHGTTNLSSADETTIRTAMKAGKKAVTDLGLICHGWVTPSSTLNPTYLNVTNDYFEYGYTVYKGETSTGQTMTKTLKSYGLWRGDIHMFKTYYQSILSDAMTNNGMVCVYGHGYELISEERWSLSNLRTIIDYCITNNIEILTPYQSCLKLYGQKYNED